MQAVFGKNFEIIYQSPMVFLIMKTTKVSKGGHTGFDKTAFQRSRRCDFNRPYFDRSKHVDAFNCTWKQFRIEGKQ